MARLPTRYRRLVAPPLSRRQVGKLPEPLLPPAERPAERPAPLLVALPAEQRALLQVLRQEQHPLRARRPEQPQRLGPLPARQPERRRLLVLRPVASLLL